MIEITYKILLIITDHNGDETMAIVEAENNNAAIIKFLNRFDGSQNIKKIEVQRPVYLL